MDFTNFGELFKNKFVKITLAILFYVFILNIIYQLGVFLGIDKNLLDMYYIWIAIIALLISILPLKRSNL